MHTSIDPVSVSWGSASEAETEALGAKLGRLLLPGDVVALSGALGAGKTRFVTGVARGIETRARVRSPTFTLVNIYHGRIPLLHVDLYRIETPEFSTLGVEEGLDEAAAVVEWGERLPEALWAEALCVRLEVLGDDQRLLEATAAAPRSRALLAAWRAAEIAP